MLDISCRCIAHHSLGHSRRPRIHRIRSHSHLDIDHTVEARCTAVVPELDLVLEDIGVGAVVSARLGHCMDAVVLDNPHRMPSRRPESSLRCEAAVPRGGGRCNVGLGYRAPKLLSSNQTIWANYCILTKDKKARPISRRFKRTTRCSQGQRGRPKGKASYHARMAACGEGRRSIFVRCVSAEC